MPLTLSQRPETAAKFLWTEHSAKSEKLKPWLREVGVVERRPVRTSRDVMSRRSNRPRHREALYFPRRRLWTTEYSCKVWCKPCRRRLIPRQHSRPSWRPSDVAPLEETVETDSERGD
ncbi:hypothetical protein Taro_013567 [Colocasia esculenta]|uniref:Uncharacterized protein n=1 Tax=Colocasia esculenta TaxID=4460 RepID=A0A843UFY2_COLES|nr:hypothetical protein [Colocasia esculenta]